MKKEKLKLILILDILFFVISIFAYKYIFQVETTKKIYSAETVRFLEENNNPVFKINKIILYGSANAVDNSDGELKNIDISQFSDIEIYINNKLRSEEITAENTVNELFIDNIEIDANKDFGEKVFNYKNPLKCGKYDDIENFRDDGILFTVVNSVEKNLEANYDENIFYTDCSNPISLGYVNKNILTNCEVNSNNISLSFDGSILEKTGVDLKSLDNKISFTIHLVNNYNEEYICPVVIDNKISVNEDIYSGYIMKIINIKEDELKFLKVN